MRRLRHSTRHTAVHSEENPVETAGTPNETTRQPYASTDYDLVVVGAGPAGITAAREATQAGLRTLLVESSSLPRRKSCGGMLNEYAQRFLEGVAPLPHGMVLDPAWVNFRYYDWDRKIKKPCSLRFANVDRAIFDEWLLNLLPDRVDVWDKSTFVSCADEGCGVDVQLRRDGREAHVHARWVIGADGARSAVRRSHPAWPQTQSYTTVQEYVEIEPGSVEPYFDCIYSRHIDPAYGYGYIVPKGDVAIVGSVFFPKTKGVTAMHEKALATWGQRYPLGAARRREGGSAIQVKDANDIIAGQGRVLMAGEAAGIMSPSSGEGISFALNSGKLAGQAVVRAAREKTEAVALYDESLKPIRKNIARRLFFFPVMNSNWGKWLGGCMPTPLISKVTEWL